MALWRGDRWGRGGGGGWKVGEEAGNVVEAWEMRLISWGVGVRS